MWDIRTIGDARFILDFRGEIPGVTKARLNYAHRDVSVTKLNLGFETKINDYGCCKFDPNPVKLTATVTNGTMSLELSVCLYDSERIQEIGRLANEVYDKVIDSNVDQWIEKQQALEEAIKKAQERQPFTFTTYDDAVVQIDNQYRFETGGRVLALLKVVKTAEEDELNFGPLRKKTFRAMYCNFEEPGYAVVTACQRSHGNGGVHAILPTDPITHGEMMHVKPALVAIVDSLPELPEPFREKAYYQKIIRNL